MTACTERSEGRKGIPSRLGLSIRLGVEGVARQ
jgi:hypothetical protein